MASTTIDNLIDEQPPPEDHVGHHCYWLSTLEGEYKGYPKIELPEPIQILGAPGDLILAHYLLGHNIGGNYQSKRVRQAVYFRLRRVGHQHRWRECLCDELLEFDPVRVALIERPHDPARKAR